MPLRPVDLRAHPHDADRTNSDRGKPGRELGSSHYPALSALIRARDVSQCRRHDPRTVEAYRWVLREAEDWRFVDTKPAELARRRRAEQLRHEHVSASPDSCINRRPSARKRRQDSRRPKVRHPELNAAGRSRSCNPMAAVQTQEHSGRWPRSPTRRGRVRSRCRQGACPARAGSW